MNPTVAMFAGMACLAASVFTLPVEHLPHRSSISGRLMVSQLLMLAAGAVLGYAFIA